VFARIASFEGGNEERMQQLSQERMSAGEMSLPEGCTGAMVLVGDGRRLFVTYFDTRAAVDAAEQSFDQMGDTIPEDIRGRRTSVDVWEVVWNSSDQ
jgi:hypothetical protein